MRTLSVASEAAAPYAGGGALGSVLDEMDRVVRELATVDLDAADEPAIRAGIARMQRHSRQLQARITDAAAQLTRRQARRLNPEQPDSPKARQRAERDVQNELADTLKVTHSQAKDTVRAGGALESLSADTRAAFESGDISARHVRKLRQTVRGLVGVIDASELEGQLLEVARRLNATEFGRHCRDVTARHEAEQAQRDLDRLHQRRYGSVVQDDSGMTRLNGGWVGAQAEVVQTAVEVFRDKDQPGETRSTEQRTADAIFNALAHALRHAESTDHGNRPHVFVHVDQDQLDRGDDGVAETIFTGTLPLTELKPLIEDAVITRIVKDAHGQVVDVGRATRTVPPSVWRGVLARDRRCTLCGAPPQRCQAAHLDRRWLDGAGVSIPELALLCWTCHRRVDAAKLTGRLHNNVVSWHRRDGTPYDRFPRGRPPDRRRT
ncbi:MAG: DUF222 domain-containing protein [Nitriliruptorales bacterium]|nr:DUF222 domain-containing protein [Nitriliruptorales bacterium]